ncbi:ABC transporter ATP-binding protein [Amycolatopsis regifaucium]|uniref:Peptide ABC transporter ATP-binding protein n=1 Tax=Amycolatopsis regifaucium TaxID=546365 RepID=A0A154MNY9_9PSEU|nr:ABC transporter ATP-binding protein [Amycolatopsis regifaucium]KZB86012.1 peptide ABC transporter ATP-binding protein [Amycolatopsis regifaucium]OKA04903.1 peptide ABC transporter ATP-binding protein [Amycolatopsis regifaucium]SFH74793.1 peptide/nickel transport system ATP-binding protein [Amycolatopsis regifaucium]
MRKEVVISGVTVSLDATGDDIVRDIGFELGRGEVMGVVGESGSGKSTLALALLGFARNGATITGGRVIIDGVDLLTLPEKVLRRTRGAKVAYVPQDPATALNPSLSLATQLTEGLRLPKREALSRVRGLLDTVRLPSDDAFLGRRPRQLSGGQQQRAAIAMAVAAGPRLIVLDEPTTGLDVSTQARVLELVRDLCRDNDMAAIYVSHDLAVVADVADQVTVMYGGEVVESGGTRDVLTRATHPYTRALLAAVPSASRRHHLVPIPGRAPSPGESRPGCVFAPRCGHAAAECTSTRPHLEPAPSGTLVRCLRTHEAVRAPRNPPRAAGPRAVSDHAVFSAAGLNAGYGGRQVLFDASFSLARGECLAVVGESGSGKTTMSRCLVGLHEEQRGTLTFEGRPIPPTAGERTKETRREVQYVFQNPYGSLNPRRSVENSLAVPLRHYFGATKREAGQRVREALERVEIPARFAGHSPAELSGGQRQRVAIARALVCEPKLLICDEVTSALDVSVQASVVELLRSLLSDGLSVIFVTHDLAVVRSITDQVVVLSQGRVVESGTTESVLTEPAHPYTRSLMAATLEVPLMT